MSRVFAVLGAVAYFAWGALHLLAAANSFRFASGVEDGLIQGRLFQGAFYVAVFALVAIVVAVGWNWRNSRAGYWVNLFAVSTRSLARPIFVGGWSRDVDAGATDGAPRLITVVAQSPAILSRRESRTSRRWRC